MAQRQQVSRRDLLRLAAGGAALCVGCAPSAAQLAPAGGASAAATARQPIKIGASIAATGSYSRTGLYQLEAYELWEKQVNGRGGLLGRPVRLMVRDDQSDARTGEQLYEQLITEDEVDLLLGPYSSQVTQAVANVAEKYGYPLLAAGASASELWTSGDKQYLFGVYSVAERYFAGVLETAAREGYRTIALLYENTLFPQSTAQGAVQLARDKGMQVVLTEPYPVQVADVSSLLLKAKSQNAEVLLGGSYLPDALLITRQTKDLDYNPKLMAFSVATAMPDYGEALGKDADYVFGPSMWEPELKTPGNQEFVRAYQEMFNREPDYHAAAGYSACQVLQAAVTQLQSLDNRRIRDWLASAEMETILPGKFRVDANGMMIGHEVVAIQWQRGKKVVVWPAKHATGSYKLPAPAWSQRG
jgi:branched-chain amino acid transport system substrate-binding protein